MKDELTKVKVFFILFKLALTALLFEIDELIDIMAIGGLAGYSVISLCVIILR
jgi:hypothetical protein